MRARSCPRLAGGCKMNALLKLKEWLTVADAAKHLSTVCSEPVTEPDVLRLGLDGHLKLSTYFVNGVSARRGKVVSSKEIEVTLLPKDPTSPIPTHALGILRIGDIPDKLPAEVVERVKDGSLILVVSDLHIRDDKFVHLEDEVISIKGLWDLPLIGAERLDIEHAYQQMTGGPEVTGVVLDGAFVQDPQGQLLQLHESFDAPGMKPVFEEVRKDLKAHGVKLKRARRKSRTSPDLTHAAILGTIFRPGASEATPSPSSAHPRSKNSGRESSVPRTAAHLSEKISQWGTGSGRRS
jgi:hypothetical protein